jgi:uncharacterized protein YheU (UPF0270 family)
LEESIEMAIRQLKRGEVVIVFDETTQTVNIDPRKYSRVIEVGAKVL